LLDDRAAAAAAAAFLDEYHRQLPNSDSHQEVRVAPELGFKDGRLLIVPWNSVALLDHDDEDAELGGNTSIVVDLETGECRFMSVAEELDYLDRGFDV
jgi:hypothetical protein